MDRVTSQTSIRSQLESLPVPGTGTSSTVYYFALYKYCG